MPARPQSLIILGGGLAGGLIALALAERRPEVRVMIVEAGGTLGGNHLWSFFGSDIAAAERPLVEPLIVHRWPAYDVRFPAYQRTIEQPYHSITSKRLDAVVRAALPADAIVHAVVDVATPRSVRLAGSRSLEADAVIDARGAGDLSALDCGWQKFVGQTLHLARPHGLIRPVVMDATVDQSEGYRFVYLLPFGPSEIFVEDTYYRETPDLDVPAFTARIATFAAAQGWEVAAPNHIETGILPVLMGGDFKRFWPATDQLARAGARAALFQPLTSYSLPDAVRFAVWFASQPDLAAADTRAYALHHWRSGGYYRLLSKMLLRAAEPPERYRVLERFYRLPAPLIERFYAGRSTLADRIRILAGRPPVSVSRAIRALGTTK
ncbi:MAG: lycopene beta-cyclase CrtY [Sphingomicrobium sp.]